LGESFNLNWIQNASTSCELITLAIICFWTKAILR